ncbi:MAG: hypothetical protein L7H00_02530 [Vulcanisaeta sp.]|nr:hypothetical protein [Vulcanisaeta sp.]
MRGSIVLIVFAIFIALTIQVMAQSVLPIGWVALEALPINATLNIPCQAIASITLYTLNSTYTISISRGAVMLNSTLINSTCVNGYYSIGYRYSGGVISMNINGISLAIRNVTAPTLNVTFYYLPNCTYWLPGVTGVPTSAGVLLSNTPVMSNGLVYTSFGVCPSNLAIPSVSAPSATDANGTFYITIQYQLPQMGTTASASCTINGRTVTATPINSTGGFSLVHEAVFAMSIPTEGVADCQASNGIYTTTFTVRVYPPILVTITNNGTTWEVGYPINASITITGGNPPYTVSSTTFTPDKPGLNVFPITITDRTGATETVLFVVYAQPKVDVSATLASVIPTFTGTNLVIKYTVSGGVPPYKVYVILNNAPVAEYVVKSPGTYTIPVSVLMGYTTISIVAIDSLGVKAIYTIGYEAGMPLVVIVLAVGLVLIGMTAFLYIVMKRHREAIKALLTE